MTSLNRSGHDESRPEVLAFGRPRRGQRTDHRPGTGPCLAPDPCSRQAMTGIAACGGEHPGRDTTTRGARDCRSMEPKTRRTKNAGALQQSRGGSTGSHPESRMISPAISATPRPSVRTRWTPGRHPRSNRRATTALRSRCASRAEPRARWESRWRAISSVHVSRTPTTAGASPIATVSLSTTSSRTLAVLV